jgi:hypothetical protein
VLSSSGLRQQSGCAGLTKLRHTVGLAVVLFPWYAFTHMSTRLAAASGVADEAGDVAPRLEEEAVAKSRLSFISVPGSSTDPSWPMGGDM